VKSGEAKLFGCILVVAVILVAVAAMPILLKGGSVGPPPPQPRLEKLTRDMLVPKDAHLLGDPMAPATIVEFSDLQCSHCKEAEPEVKRRLSERKGQFNLVFRHYKIAQTHGNSQIMAQAAEAAGEQGKFFEMVHAIFEDQEKLSKMDLLEVKGEMTKIAGNLKLDMIKFRSALDHDRTLQRYLADMNRGVELKLDATPTFFFIDKQGKVTRFFLTAQAMKHLDDPKTWQ
jgi:protein-disulfide isomerase